MHKRLRRPSTLRKGCGVANVPSWVEQRSRFRLGGEPDLTQSTGEKSQGGGHRWAQKCVLLHPSVFLWNARKVFVLNGRPVGTRTPDLYRVNLSFIGFTTTYKTAGTAKVRGSSYKTYFLWVGLWVGKSRRTPEPPHVFPRTFLDSLLDSRHPGANRFGKH